MKAFASVKKSRLRRAYENETIGEWESYEFITVANWQAVGIVYAYILDLIQPFTAVVMQVPHASLLFPHRCSVPKNILIRSLGGTKCNDNVEEAMRFIDLWSRCNAAQILYQ